MFRASRSAEQVRVEPAPRLGSGAEGRVLLPTVGAGCSLPPGPREAWPLCRTIQEVSSLESSGLDPRNPLTGPFQMADQLPCCEETLGCQERQSFTSYFSLWFEITAVKQFHVAATDVISGPDLLFQLKK